MESKRRKVFFCTQAGVRYRRALVFRFSGWRKEALGRGRAGQGRETGTRVSSYFTLETEAPSVLWLSVYMCIRRQINQ